MNRQAWSARIILRYVLYQLPALVILIIILIFVRRWVDLPAWLAWSIVALWVAKDVVLYPFTWHAYDRSRPRSDLTRMLGAKGIAEDRLAPSGFVRVRGELWQAEIEAGRPPVERGEAVRIRDIQGLKLLVEPEDQGAGSS
jgi:membrane protein implicated in regulation of membrane protease activity